MQEWLYQQAYLLGLQLQCKITADNVLNIVLFTDIYSS